MDTHAAGERSPFTHDAKRDALVAQTCTLQTFDKVKVSISVDSSRPHRPKLALALLEPAIPKV